MSTTESGFEVEREFLTFSYLGFVERLCRIEAVLERAENDAPAVGAAVFSKLHRVIDDQWEELRKYAYGSRLARLQSADSRAVFTTLQSFHAQLPSVHEAIVRWVSAPWAPPQITSALLLSVRTALGTRAHDDLLALAPIVAKVGIYDFLGDFRGMSEPSGEPTTDPTATVVWATPAAEIENPLSWVMLFHEVAHTLIAKSNCIPTALRDRRDSLSPTSLALLSSYVAELLADRIATDIAGPAYFGALTCFGILERPRSLRLRNIDLDLLQAYPSVVDRVNMISAHLESKLNLPLTLRNECDMHAANRVMQLFQGRCQIDGETARVLWEETEESKWLGDYEQWGSTLERAYDLVSERYSDGVRYNREMHTHAVRLSKQLRDYRPVAASVQFDAFQMSAASICETPLSSASEVERRVILTGLTEYPNDPLAILNAAWIAYLQYWQAPRREALLANNEPVPSTDEIINDIREEMEVRDSLVAKSIESGLLHRELVYPED